MWEVCEGERVPPTSAPHVLVWEINKVGSIHALNYKVGSISKILHSDWPVNMTQSDWVSYRPLYSDTSFWASLAQQAQCGPKKKPVWLVWPNVAQCGPTGPTGPKIWASWASL